MSQAPALLPANQKVDQDVNEPGTIQLYLTVYFQNEIASFKNDKIKLKIVQAPKKHLPKGWNMLYSGYDVSFIDGAGRMIAAHYADKLKASGYKVGTSVTATRRYQSGSQYKYTLDIPK